MNDVVTYLFPFTSMLGNSDEFPLGGSLLFGGTKIEDIMNREPKFVYETSPLCEVAEKLLQERINELPVVDENKHIIGQVNVHEIVKGYLESRNRERD